MIFCLCLVGTVVWLNMGLMTMWCDLDDSFRNSRGQSSKNGRKDWNEYSREQVLCGMCGDFDMTDGP